MTKPQPDKKSKMKYDAEYIRYVEHGESAAVFITRDIVETINTSGKWIDISEIDGEKNFYDHRAYWNFKSFVAELFPRKTQPVYPQGASDEEIKYITWQTAHADINAQRASGYVGSKYKIRPQLINANAGKFNIVKALYSKQFDGWHYAAPVIDHSADDLEWQIHKIAVPPEWSCVGFDIEALGSANQATVKRTPRRVNVRQNLIRHHKEYEKYIGTGRALAAFIIRNFVDALDTTGKWIDVLSIDESTQTFTVELFPQKMLPTYQLSDSERHIRYMMWRAERIDIDEQRAAGYVGEKFKIRTTQKDINAGKFEECYALWDKAAQKFVEQYYPVDKYEIRDYKIPFEPDWQYKILSVERLNAKEKADGKKTPEQGGGTRAVQTKRSAVAGASGARRQGKKNRQ